MIVIPPGKIFSHYTYGEGNNVHYIGFVSLLLEKASCRIIPNNAAIFVSYSIEL